MRNVSQDLSRCKGKSRIALHLLIIIFGISTWTGINGIYVQVPVLINTSPESWTLPVYLVLVIQAANIGPLLYTILQYFQCKTNESWWILCLLVLGTCAMGLLTFFYSEKTVINETEHSVILFTLTFFVALLGCFSSVLFMPYLRNFNQSFLVSFFIGEGLSGVLPSIVALIQGVGDNSDCTSVKNDTTNSPNSGLNFSPNDYFLFIFIILFLSLTAFIILEYSPFVQNAKNLDRSVDCICNETRTSISNCPNDIQNVKHSSLKGNNKDLVVHNHNEGLMKQTRYYLFILLAICYFFSNGFFPSIQSYSCLPYGNVAYKLSITLSQFANPLVCLLAYWFTVSDIKIINYLSIVCLTVGSYVTYLALMSPTPPLHDTKLGLFLVIVSWTGLIGSISYLKLSIVSIFRNTMLPKILFNAGAVMQIGSASGAIFSFIAINFTEYFKMPDNCALKNE
ncbi:solute carrier family 52, riboflavin transporter, member 3-A-like [Hylaeus volcanicus]|uniref:solute carrier family 52, riboflavin transporter, member 3-A-like n=1 Tax=Hylaeus volcanicus TaxID=313075 RepID=UPI0023B832C9|nr:solute carrier family 52, riboflavin transporter, member 3-A-like [Hylaeus volcanicus]